MIDNEWNERKQPNYSVKDVTVLPCILKVKFVNKYENEGKYDLSFICILSRKIFSVCTTVIFYWIEWLNFEIEYYFF